MDMWCDFCGDKIKATTVKVQGRTHEVCNHCKSLTVEDRTKSCSHSNKDYYNHGYHAVCLDCGIQVY